VDIPLLKGIVILFALAIGVILVCHKFKIPSVVGYLITGILAGPYGFELIKEIHEVEILAEIGIILLLFTIGIEFSLDKLLALKKPVLLGGLFQFLLTAGLSFVLATFIGLSIQQAIFAGLLITLSSTAIVLKIMQERAEMDSPHGRGVLGVLIFQDIAVVPMMLFVPVLAGTGGDVTLSLLQVFLKGIVILIGVWASSKWLIPHLLYWVVKTKNRELFLLSIVVMCFAIAWLTSEAGLSLALGAFLAGLIISESEYSYQALGSVLPFKDIFSSFFFVSIGMLFHVGYVMEHFFLIIMATIAIILLKIVAASVSAVLIGFPLRSALLAGFALSQVGEFSFILSKAGEQHGLFTGDYYNLFLAISVISMALTPFIIAGAPVWVDSGMRILLPQKMKNRVYPRNEDGPEQMREHLIIIGFGINGKNVSRAAAAAEVPYRIIEMNPDVVKRERDQGEPIFQGDASQEAVLKHVHIKQAKVLVIAISDPVAVRKITEMARRLNKKVYIIVRTRYVSELEPLYELGANEVIPEEFETSIEIFIRVLNKYLIPKDEIAKFVSELRSEGYEMFRCIDKKTNHLLHLKMHVPDIEIHPLRIDESSLFVGKSMAEIALRNQYGVTVLAIRRNAEILFNPDGDTILEANDILILVGLTEQLTDISSTLGIQD